MIDIIDMTPKKVSRPSRRTTSRIVIHRFHVEPRTHDGMREFFLENPEGVATTQLAGKYSDKKAIFERWKTQNRIPKRYADRAFVPYHFSVDIDGTIAQHLPLESVGAHAAPGNHNSIAVACLGDWRVEVPPVKMMTALIDLCFWLQKNRPHDHQPYKILGHDDILKGIKVRPKGCPGALMDLDTVRSHVRTLRKYADKREIG